MTQKTEAIVEALQPGQPVVPESTTWRGTTSEGVEPTLEASTHRGLRLGRDIWLGQEHVEARQHIISME